MPLIHCGPAGGVWPETGEATRLLSGSSGTSGSVSCSSFRSRPHGTDLAGPDGPGWVEATGGCYVAIFHPGVFDDEDAQLRERLLTGFLRLLEGRPVWRCSLQDLEQWWRAREDLTTAASGS